MPHTFNPSPRESHTSNALEGIENAGKERLRLLSLQSPSLGRGETSLVAWLLCLSGFQVELWVFIVHVTNHPPSVQRAHTGYTLELVQVPLGWGEY